MQNNQSPCRVACIQMDVKQNCVEENLITATRLIQEACVLGVNLMVLPEMFHAGCELKSRTEAYQIAEPVPNGRTTAMLAELSQKNGVYIVAGVVEQEQDDLYNTAVLTGPKGYIGKYRKLHPCEDEVYWVENGDLGIPVFHTPIGRIAMLICLDAYYPETFRICALQGADVVCVPSNWTDVTKSRNLPVPYRTMAPTINMAGALSNHILVAACDRIGREGEKCFPGQSVIANQWGAPISMADDQEGIFWADVDLCDSRRKYFHPTNSRLANRRVDVYSATLGYDPAKYR